ncbi:hypothetical protein [Streptomyces sp. TRM70350]|uniref:hypothetical protein n=1 Tax=Streptomyces sp. TRM70350 TaxID=2856165 RepID=UPI00210F2936|nr:hypothetical protein [Streptomyces sp. TRM70350]
MKLHPILQSLACPPLQLIALPRQRGPLTDGKDPATEEIRALVGEVRRVLRPGGTFVYTVRHTGDAHYDTGVAHGDSIFEQGGFAVHFFDRALVDALAAGWTLDEVHAFEEGELPRRLWRITQSLPRHPGR